jgi:hypothetical protein
MSGPIRVFLNTLIDRAIGALQQVHSKSRLDISNLESVFTALEMAQLLDRLPGHSGQQIAAAIDSLKTVIIATLEQSITFPRDAANGRVPSSAYATFCRVLAQIAQSGERTRSVSIITFNYDFALDVALHLQGWTTDYCLYPLQTASNKIDVLKLHGSLNWMNGDPDGEKTAVPIEEFISTRMAQVGGSATWTIPIRHVMRGRLSAKGNSSDEPSPVIVPPTWQKAGHQPQLTRVWRKAADHLSEAQYIYILGYSLPDTDSLFRLLFALGTVGPRVVRKFVVCNPDRRDGPTDSRFRALLGPAVEDKYTYVSEKFEKYVEQLASDLQ